MTSRTRKATFKTFASWETASHGRILVLDGCLQVTEADEYVYQEMIVHVPLIEHGAARKVLVIGAGDGGVLRRVLQHPRVQRVVMVEVDASVIRLVREHLPGIAGSAWDDPRAEVIVGDGQAYVAAAETNSFDVVIVDSTDPVGVSETLFTDAFYQDCARILSPNGIMVNQGGVPFLQGPELQEASRRRARHFPYVSAYVAAVPTYVGGFMALGVSSKRPIATILDDEITARAEDAGLIGTTNYWSPRIHKACFSLPPYISRFLGQPV